MEVSSREHQPTAVPHRARGRGWGRCRARRVGRHRSGQRRPPTVPIPRGRRLQVANGEIRRRRSLDADLDGYVAELLTKAIPTGVLDDEITADEKDALYAHLRGIGAIAPAERGYDEGPGAGEQAGEIQDPDQLATVLGFDPGLRRYFERDWHLSTPMFHPVGGMDALPVALTHALVGEIHTAAEVRSVGDDGDGVSARLVDGSEIRADHGICTLPPWIAAALASPWDTG